MYKENQ